MINKAREECLFYGLLVCGGIGAIITSAYFLGNLYLPTIATVNSTEIYTYGCSSLHGSCSQINASLSYNVNHKLYNGTLFKKFSNPWDANEFNNEIGQQSLIEIYYNRYDPNIWYLSVYSDPLMVILLIGLIVCSCCTICVIPILYQLIKENEFLIELKKQGLEQNELNIQDAEKNEVKNQGANIELDNSNNDDKLLISNNNELDIQKKVQTGVDLANKCQICLDLKISAIAECGHVGCHKCLTTLLEENKDCPFCRAKIIMIRPVFLN